MTEKNRRAKRGCGLAIRNRPIKNLNGKNKKVLDNQIKKCYNEYIKRKKEVIIMTNTMTYAQAIDNAINGTMNEATVERLTALKEQLAKRSTSKTPTKVQRENEVIMINILNALADIGEPTTVTGLITHGVEGFPTADGKVLTSQKASSMLRKLIDAGKVVKTIEGKRALFAVA